MKFKINHGNNQTYNNDCLIIGIFEQGGLTQTAKKIDSLSQGYISQLLKQGDFRGKLGQTFLIYPPFQIKAKRILLVGCGKETSLKELDFRKIIHSASKVLNTFQVKTPLFSLLELKVTGRDLFWKVKHSVELIMDALYSFQEYKSKPETFAPLQEITLSLTHHLASKELKHCEEALKQGLAIASGVTFTKNIANQPSNICTPHYLAEEAKKLSKQHKNMKIHILDEKTMKKLGMGALLAVAKGSNQAPKLICLEYKGSSKKQAPIAFVGKGITFDTGGISLKPAENMIGMKYDMCGAATVLGTLKTAADLKLPLHLIGVIAAAENMPSGTATKPEDIVTTLSGQTVEILNTDAEGRLVLCDALTYCERYHPEIVIDIATLTGAVVIALGHHASGLLSNNDSLEQALLAAGQESFDRAWALPLWEEYQELLKSPFADMTNIGGRTAGTITAACFLSRFAKKFKWAHLDVAGTAAMMFGNDRYATGRPVPMLVQYLINKCNK